MDTGHVTAQAMNKTKVDSVVDYGSREGWLAARSKGIGASEAAALFDLHPWASRLSLWLEKSGRVEREEPVGDHAERMEWGHHHEPTIAAVYERRTKRRLWQFSEYSIAHHPRNPVMFATPDRFIIEAPDRRGDGTLQIKTTEAEDDWRDGPPPYVQCQVQHELAVTGRDYAAVACLLKGNKLLSWDIDRNEDFIAELEEQCKAFWASIEAGEPPAVDGHRATLSALKRLHPLDNGEEIGLPAEAAAWWEALQAAKQGEKAAEAQREAAEANLRAVIGPNSFGRLPDGRVLSLKHTTVRAHVKEVAEYTYRALREVKAAAKRINPRKARAA